MSKATQKAILSSMPKYERVYINIVRMRGGRWAVCWKAEFCGADKRSKAVEQRRKFLEYLQSATGGAQKSFWRAHHLKTIRLI